MSSTWQNPAATKLALLQSESAAAQAAYRAKTDAISIFKSQLVNAENRITELEAARKGSAVQEAATDLLAEQQALADHLRNVAIPMAESQRAMTERTAQLAAQIYNAAKGAFQTATGRVPVGV